MTTSGPIRGQSTGGFWPDPSSDIPDYSTPAVIETGLVDAQGNLQIRGPVVTDEGGFREPFAGAALSADWLSGVGAGIITVAGSLVTISTPVIPVASDLQYISRVADYLPMTLAVLMGQQGGAAPFNLSAVAGSTMEAFFGLYFLDEIANPNLDPSHATAQSQYVEWAILASAAATSGTVRSSSHSGPGGQQTAAVTVTSRATPGWRAIALDGEGAIYRDGANQTQALPPPTTRANASGQTPDIYSPLFFSMGIRSLGAPGASQGILVADAVFIKNLNRLVVNTGF